MQREKLINKESLLIISGLFIIAGIFYLVYFIQQKQRSLVDDIPAVSVDQTKEFNSVSASSLETVSTPKRAEELPASYLLKVAFQSQAPYGDWSEPYENACEEASIITAEHYLKNQALSKEQMKSEIDAAVAWQLATWGVHADLNAEQTLKLAEDYFKLSGKVVRNYSVNDIKRNISNGVPVLAPTDGQMLGNPNFRGAGPEYHMIVIIGYDDSQGIFITNDVGTRKGAGYIYKYQTVLDAISGPKKSMEKAIVVLSSL